MRLKHLFSVPESRNLLVILKEKTHKTSLSLFGPMEFPIKFDTVKSGWCIVDIEGSNALDKLLGQLGIYATWLSSIAYMQKQLRIFIFFYATFFFL